MPGAPVDQLGRWGQLGESDSIQVEGRRYRVCGWISYDYKWVEYLLDDGRWLGVEGNRPPGLSLWDDQPTAWVPPDGDSFTYRGARYTRSELYTARWMAASLDGPTGPGWVDVVEYVGTGPALAAVMNWGEGEELSFGRRLDDASVSL